MSEENSKNKPAHFIRNIIIQDKQNNKNDGQVVTRFPPEPNGFLHIGHAKSICLNFGMAAEFNGRCHLRFDDTNPVKEDDLFVESIKKDVQWLGFDWGKHLYNASDYFQKLYDYAVDLIKADKAYVCELNEEQMREYRGTLTQPGKESPHRNRPMEESLDIFDRMKKGEFAEGQYVLRAKIDMASPNINMRDPVVYRIRKAHHQITGDDWCIYPMYDYAHCVSDALEHITHSICTLEFEDHRPLYDWFLDQLTVPCHPQQIEFARLNLEYTVMSKRKLLQLVEEKHVSGWDDPRMPTIAGMRRRGYTPAGIRSFCERIGVAKRESTIDMGLLEQHIRDDLDVNVNRAMAVLKPIKVTLTNYPADKEEEFSVKNHPKDESKGRRQVPFSGELYIEQDDFMENPPKKYFRLTPGGKVRLRNAYVITCDEVIKDANGNIKELKCSYDERTLGGKTPEGEKKVKGIIHWVSAKHAIAARVNVYDRLFTVANPLADKQKDFLELMNSQSLEVIEQAYLEPSLKSANVGDCFQFERLGFFCVDVDSQADQLIFNRTATLRDNWAKKNN